MKLFYGLLLVILFSPLVWSQQQGEDEFPIGVFSDSLLFFTNDEAYDTLIDLGINYVIEDVSVNTNSRLQPFNVIASNADSPIDVINHYSNAIYSVWEAENSSANFWGTGFKHTDGIQTTYKGKSCWSTDTLTTTVDSLIYGPYYAQEKKYTRLNYRPWWNQKIQYKVRYRIALEDKPQMPGNTEVCKLRVNYVVNTYNPASCTTSTAWNTTIQFEERVLTLDDFPDDNFYTYTVNYEFPDSLVPDNRLYGRILYESEFEYSDVCGATGAEFALDWYGIGKLYIDYVDVVDPLGEDLTDPLLIPEIQNEIDRYLVDYYSWENLTYWYIRDEPHWIDCYLPAKIMEGWVNTLSSGRFHTITEFYPSWANQKNGDEDIAKYVEIAEPYKLMIDAYPFSENATEPLSFYLNLLRNKFQFAAQADSKFWYVAQGFGQKTDLSLPEYCGWRRPTADELKSSVMLALAHGSKGIMFWKYFTNDYYVLGATCPDPVAFDCIIGLREDGFPKSPLWYLIADNLAPRLKGKLGKTLLDLDYTGNYLQLQYSAPTQNPAPDPVTYDYLTIGIDAIEDDMNWHAGFLENPSYADDKYFLLANLWTTSNKTIKVKITEPVPGYVNYRFRNVEADFNFDTTFTSEIIELLSLPAGEGYLYEVAPVVKYGGRLIYDEEIASETLYDEMVIENGATLGIYGDYDVDADIIVKDGGRIVNTGNGKITFYNDHKLILQGNSTLSGLSQSKLVLDFVSPTENNGIIADSGLVIIISNCEIKNAGTGITVSSFSSTPPESEDFHFRVDSVDFIGCEEFGINITGQYVNKAMIENCTFNSSTTGVSAVNLDEAVIRKNGFTNTEMGICLINITKADVISNIITSNQYSMQGIFFDNSGGNLRANIVQGHTNGIQLGNSSPDIGSNVIYDNKYHGIYIGVGSLPNMLGGRWVSDPPVFYAASGYNEIYENGGWQELNPPPYNDGSEIYKQCKCIARKGL